MIHITIKNNVGDSLTFAKHKPDNVFDFFYNVFFSFSFTQTTSAKPNLGTVQIFGIDKSVRDRIKTLGEQREGKEISKELMTWIPFAPGRKDGLLGEYQYKMPQIELSLNLVGDKLKAPESIDWKFKEVSWSMLEIWSQDSLLYSGDIIDIDEDIDSITINTGTQHYFLDMLFSERVLMTDGDEDILYWRQEGNKLPDNVNLIQWSPKTYANIGRKIINNWLIDDPYEIVNLFDQANNQDLNKIALKALSEYTKGKEAKDLELSWEILQYKRLSKAQQKLKKDNGEKIKTNEVYTLSGKISDILVDIAEKGFLTIFCQNDVFNIQSYWVTNNYKNELILQSYALPDEDFEYFPVGNVTVSKDGRGVFTSSLKMLLEPSTGVTIKRGPDEDDVEMYIDTVEVSGSVDGGVVTYSGRVKDFLWKEDI